MAMYEYRCTECDERFSLLRPMAEADDPVRCTHGHPARRLISVVAGLGGERGEMASMPTGGGGCCGGACGCSN
jgi:putative FmdB family regulatory protein